MSHFAGIPSSCAPERRVLEQPNAIFGLGTAFSQPSARLDGSELGHMPDVIRSFLGWLPDAFDAVFIECLIAGNDGQAAPLRLDDKQMVERILVMQWQVFDVGQVIEFEVDRT